MLVGYKKGISVFMSFLIVFSIFSVYSVSAVVEFPINCCLDDGAGNYCVNLEDEASSCSEGNFRSGSCDVSSGAPCETGTCIPADGGSCLSSYTRQQCSSIGGQFSLLDEDTEPACQLGCCADSLECGIMQQQECNGNFISSILDQGACLLECRPETTGCCVESNSCTYQTAGDSCSGEFLEDQYCYERDFCNERYESHAYTYLGDASIIPEADKDVYWYDSNGNMEERVGDVDERTGQVVPIPGAPEGLTSKGDCDYPDEIAFDPDDSKGGKYNAYCKSTACVVECENCEPSSFKNGESICLNIFGGKYMNEDRSTALREYVLSCVNGEIDGEQIIEDRSRYICIDDSRTYNVGGEDVERQYARADIDNKWQDCLGCGGDSSGILDYGGYVPGLGGILVSAGHWCSSDDNYYGKVFGNLGNSQNCEEFGNNQGIQMCYYDHDLWAPIGSCNPIYPPAKNSVEQCGICGKGGDGKVNMCTEQECNALGDCQFEKDRASGGLIASGSLALGTAVGASLGAWLACKYLTFGTDPGFCDGVSAGSIGLIAVQSSIYWGVFGLIYGLGAGSQNDYDELDEYGYDFVTADGLYDLASMIAMARAIDYALGDDASIEQGSDESEVDDGGNAIGVIGGGLILLTNSLAYYSWGGWDICGYSSFCGLLASVGGIISIYSVSDSFNSGNCVPETAYTNSDHCGECGGLEGQFYCTKERCGILGEDSGYCHWEAKNDGTADGICLTSSPTDTTPPGITHIELQMFDQDSSITGDKEVNTNRMTTKQFGWFDAVGVKINIVTDEPAKCAASFESELTYESMSGGELTFDGFYVVDHELKFNLTAQQKMNGENTLYIKCRDVSGGVNGEHDDINWIKMLFGVEPNSVPPEIIEIDPADVLNLPAGTSEVEIKLIVQDRLDEVTECKYEPTDIDDYVIGDDGNVEYEPNYDDLNNLFLRVGDGSCPGSSLSDDCTLFNATIAFDEDSSVELDLISQGYSENGTIYPYTFGCRDSYENPVLIDYSFSVYPGFDMNITYPTEGLQIYDSTPEINISSEVDSYCRYKIDNAENWTRMNAGVGMPFVNTEIEDPLSASVAGVLHRLDVKCIDFGNDVVEKSVNFFVLSDAAAPEITRVYTRGIMGSSGRLHIELNENAECKYSSEEETSFEDSDLMNAVPPTLSLGERVLSEHQTATWDSFKYYIKCRDEWDNEGSYTVYP